MLKERVMDLVTQTAILPLLFGCLGIFSLFRVLQRIRSRAHLRDAVVVVTGATSGLGRGKPQTCDVRSGISRLPGHHETCGRDPPSVVQLEKKGV